MREYYILTLASAVLAIVPSLILTILSGWAFRQNWAFWYYGSSFVSICNALYLTLFVLWVFYAPSEFVREEGLIFLVLPLLGLIFGIGAFLLLGLSAYSSLGFKDVSWAAKPLLSYPFWASVGSIVVFALSWFLPIFIKSPLFR